MDIEIVPNEGLDPVAIFDGIMKLFEQGREEDALGQLRALTMDSISDAVLLKMLDGSIVVNAVEGSLSFKIPSDGWIGTDAWDFDDMEDEW